jgi:hypothetical protein
VFVSVKKEQDRMRAMTVESEASSVVASLNELLRLEEQRAEQESSRRRAQEGAERRAAADAEERARELEATREHELRLAAVTENKHARVLTRDAARPAGARRGHPGDASPGGGPRTSRPRCRTAPSRPVTYP